MYAPGTVLALKEPRDSSPKLDRDTGEPVLKGPKGKEKPVLLEFPYNRVSVIGKSPVVHSTNGAWEGTDAVGVIIQPLTDFAGNLDEPFGKLQQLYRVESIPEVKVPQKIEVTVVDTSTEQAGKTPEEVFKAEAPGAPPAEGLTRGRTPLDPFGDVQPEKGSRGTSPL